MYHTVLYCTVLATSSFLLGFLTILLAPSAPLIYLGRFLTGAGMGAVMATATIYIVEIASTVVLANIDIDVQWTLMTQLDMYLQDMRGVLGCFIQLMGGLGILLTFVLGYWANWWQLAAAISSLVLPFALGMVAVPESPHWCLAKGE